MIETKYVIYPLINYKKIKIKIKINQYNLIYCI